jgi:hypothetical protein
MDVLHLIADLLLAETIGCGVPNKDVAGGAVADLVRNVAVESELAFCPSDIDLDAYQIVEITRVGVVHLHASNAGRCRSVCSTPRTHSRRPEM